MKLLLISRGVLANCSDQLTGTLSLGGDQWLALRAAVKASPSGFTFSFGSAKNDLGCADSS